MELLEGETLRAKLDAGPIPQKQVVDYALQVAKGLSAAHEKGIVHRDLKPENLFISRDGHLKILDFGLAKRVDTVAPGKETSAPTGSGHTQPGTVMGTMGYMSPEQVKGLPVDHRSDIFSFGAILYELLSGGKAFKRETNAETMAAILRDEPPELSKSGRNISPALDRIVSHCLEKDRNQRFQSARDIAFSLSDPTSPAEVRSAPRIAAPTKSSGFRIAVLPFKCGTSDADMLALADGLSEEVVSGLSRFRYLSVVANASADGARYVVEGSLRRGGSDLRVTAQLVDAQTGARLWSETYRRDLQESEMFAVQDDVAGGIVATVADSYGVLVHAIRAASGQRRRRPHAVEWQFQYFAYREQITPASYAALKSRLERAAERNDRQSDLWACLAQIYVDEYAFGFPGGDATSLDRALAAAGARSSSIANQFATRRACAGALLPAGPRGVRSRGRARDGPQSARRRRGRDPRTADRAHARVRARRRDRAARDGAQSPTTRAGCILLRCGSTSTRRSTSRPWSARTGWTCSLFWPFLVVASACRHLGRRAEAEAAVRDLLALDPRVCGARARERRSWHFASGLMEPRSSKGCARRASRSPRRRPPRRPCPRARSIVPDRSEFARADEGFWVAVLPFKYGERGRVPHGPGRRTDRGDRDRPVALLLSSG